MAENNRNADSVSRGIANQGIEQGGRIGLAFVDTDEPLIARGKLDTHSSMPGAVGARGGEQTDRVTAKPQAIGNSPYQPVADSHQEYDKSIAPFTLIGGEITRTVTLPLSGNRRVNMTYSIDRLDRVRTAVGERYRVVDYKTGAPHVEAKSHEAMFNGDSESINFFQLMLYANMVHTDLRLPDEEGVKMSIYGLTDLPRHGETIPKIGRANGKRTQKELVRDHLEENEEFYSRLQQTMEDIFDPEKPFEAANDDTKCKYCQWQYLCGRSK